MLGRRPLLATGLTGLLACPSWADDAPTARAAPAGKGPFPCILVLTESGAADLCTRLAAVGYLALAPALPQAGDPSPAIDAALAAEHDADRRRLGVAGFGRFGPAAWRCAATLPGLKAAVAWGGPIAGAPAATIKAPLLGLYGQDDPANTRDALLHAEAEARTAKRTIELVAYVGAAANYYTPGGPGYDEAAARDGWTRMLAWFKRHGL